MKRIAALLLALAAVVCAAACKPAEKPKETSSEEGYIAMLDCAIKLPTEFSRELLDNVLPPSETDFYINYYRENKDMDYLEALAGQYRDICEGYTEKYGEGWKLSYSVVSVDVKDEDGIANYKSYDSYYFTTYGVNTDDIDAVVFVTVNVRIESPSDSNEREKILQCFSLNGKWYSFYGARLGINL